MITVNGIATFEEDITIKKNSTLGTDSSSIITMNGIATFVSTPIFNKGIGLSSNTLTIPTENMIGYKLTSSISIIDNMFGSGIYPGSYYNYLNLIGPIGSVWNVSTSFYYAGFPEPYLNDNSILCILLSTLSNTDNENFPFEDTLPTENYIAHNFVSLNRADPSGLITGCGVASGYYTVLFDKTIVYGGVSFITQNTNLRQKLFSDTAECKLRTLISGTRIA